MADQAPATELPVYATAGATALSTLPTWLRVTGAGLGGGSGGIGEGFAEMERALGSLLQGLSISVSGLDTTPGVLCLIGALLCGGLTWADSARAVAWDPRTTRLAAAAAAALAAGCTLYATFAYRGASASVWLILALVAAGAMTWFSFQRLQAAAAPLAREA